MIAQDSGVLNILLVDDDEVDVRGVTRALRKQRIENPIAVAHDGIEALSILRGESQTKINWPYIALVDINMPCMNGIEFLQALRADPQLSDVIAFVLTTSDNDRDMLAVYRSQIAGYVLKSHAGRDFVNLVSMLEIFSLTVRFPEEHVVRKT